MNAKPIVEEDRRQAQPHHREFFRTASHETYPEPEPILDPTCIQEQMDRGEGMGVDDIKTYHRTER